MLIVMTAHAGKAEVDNVIRVVEGLGFRAHAMPGATRTAIGVTGNQGAVDLSHFENLPGVAEAIRVTKPYKLITLDLKAERTVVDLGDGQRVKDIDRATVFCLSVTDDRHNRGCFGGVSVLLQAHQGSL